MKEILQLCRDYGVACFIIPPDNYRYLCTVIFNKNGYCVNYHITDGDIKERYFHLDSYILNLLGKFIEEAKEKGR